MERFCYFVKGIFVHHDYMFITFTYQPIFVIMLIVVDKGQTGSKSMAKENLSRLCVMTIFALLYLAISLIP